MHCLKKLTLFLILSQNAYSSAVNTCLKHEKNHYDFYKSGELRWEALSPWSKSSLKKFDYAGISTNLLKAGQSYWFFIPAGSDFKIKFNPYKEILNFSPSSLILRTGNTSGLFKRQELIYSDDAKTELKIKNSPTKSYVVWIEVSKDVKLVPLAFYMNNVMTIPQGEAFKKIKLKPEKHEECSLKPSVKILNTADLKKQSIRPYQTKDSEVFMSISPKSPLKIETNAEGVIRLDFKMPLDHLSNKKSYKNWIELKKNEGHKNLILFEQATVENQLNYKGNNHYIYTKIQSYWIRNNGKKTVLTLTPFLPIQVRLVRSPHRLISKKTNKNTFFDFSTTDYLVKLQKRFQETLRGLKLNFLKNTPQEHLFSVENLKTDPRYSLRARELETLLRGQYGHFQDIFPSNTRNKSSVFLKFTPQGVEHKKRQSGLRLTPKTYLRTFSDAQKIHFIKSNSDDFVKYTIPKTKNKKLVRFLVQNDDRLKTLKVSDSNGAKYNLSLHKVPPSLPFVSRSTTADLGRKLLQSEKLSQGLTTISGHSSLPYVDDSNRIQYLEHWIPASVSWINIQAPKNTPIGLQVFSNLETSIDYKIYEQARKAGLKPFKIFKKMVQDSKSHTDYIKKTHIELLSPSNTIPEALRKEFKNNWVTLIDYLRYQNTVESYSIGNLERLSLKKTESKRLLRQLKKNIKSLKTLQKLKILSRLSLSNQVGIRSFAVLEKAKILLETKEFGVFERFTKKHLASKPTLLTSNSLQDLLFKFYVDTNEAEKGFRSLAAQVYKNPNFKSISNLIRFAYKVERFDVVEKLILAIGVEKAPLFETSSTALKNKNLSFFKFLEKNTNLQNTDFYKTLKNDKLFIKGSLNFSKTYINKKERVLFKKITGKKINKEALSDWISPLQNQKNKKTFKNQNLAVDPESRLIPLTTGTGQKLLFYESTKNNSADLSLLGPQIYKINIRPLHVKNNLKLSSIFDWVEVSNAVHSQKWPILNNKPSFSLSNLEHPKLGTPGNSEEFLIRVPFGLHKISIKNEKSPYLYQVQELNAETTTPLLPRYDLEAYTSSQNIQKSSLCLKKPVGNSTFWGNQRAQYQKVKRFVLPDLCKNNILSRNYKYAKKIIDTSKKEFKFSILPKTIYNQNLNTLALSTYNKFIQHYYNFSHNIERSFSASKAEHIYQTSDKDIKNALKHLWLEFRRFYQWQTFTDLVQDDGIWIEENPIDKNESLEALTTHALAGVLDAKSNLISSGFGVNFKIRNTEPQPIELEVRLANPGELRNKNLRLFYGVKGGEEKSILLTEKSPKRFLNLAIPPGEHILNVRVPLAARGQYVEVKASTIKDNALIPLNPKFERSYHITSRKRPIVLNVQGPTVIKYRYRGQSLVDQKYIFFKKGNHKFTIKPLKYEPSSYVRIFNFTKRKSIDFLERLNPDKIELTKTLKVKKISSLDFEPSYKSELFLPHQDFGTLSSYLTYNSKILAEEPLGNFIQNENFLESGLEYRKAIPSKSLYLKFGFLGRARQFGHSSLGGHFRLTGKWQPWISTPPVSYWLSNRNYMQKFSELNPVKSLWSSHNLAAVAQHRQITQWWTHYPQLEVFYRAQSLDKLTSVNRIYVDQDIFSTYREQNRWGLGIGDSITWQAYWDMFIRFGAKYVTDEDLSEGELIRLKASWAQMFKNLEFNIDYTYTKYLDTKNISDTENSWLHNRIIYDMWLKNQERLEFTSQFSWSPDNRESSFLLSIKYHFNNGRGFTDFYPGERNFKGLKQRLAPKYNLITNDYRK